MKNSFLILLLAVGATATAQAQTITSGTQTTFTNDFWKGQTADGSGHFEWETAANWSTGVLPTVANSVAFNAVAQPAAASTVYLTANEQPGQVSFNNGAYTIGGTGTLNISAPGASAVGYNTAIAISGADQSTTLAGAFTNVINVPINIYTYTNTSTSTVYNQQISLAAPSTAGDFAGNLTLNGLVTNESGTLEFNGQSASAGTLIIAGGLVNNNKIQFTGSTVTIQTTGSTAASGSTVALAAGTSFGGVDAESQCCVCLGGKHISQ